MCKLLSTQIMAEKFMCKMLPLKCATPHVRQFSVIFPFHFTFISYFYQIYIVIFIVIVSFLIPCVMSYNM